MTHPALRLTNDECHALTLLHHCDKSVPEIAIIPRLPVKTIEEWVASGAAKLDAMVPG